MDLEECEGLKKCKMKHEKFKFFHIFRVVLIANLMYIFFHQKNCLCMDDVPWIRMMHFFLYNREKRFCWKLLFSNQISVNYMSYREHKKKRKQKIVLLHIVVSLGSLLNFLSNNL